MISIGQIVFSKCGHDKNKAYIIISIMGEYLYLSDGEIRTIEKLKKKKLKHVQLTNYILEEIKLKLEQNKLTNSDLVKVLKPYKNRFVCSNKEV